MFMNFIISVLTSLALYGGVFLVWSGVFLTKGDDLSTLIITMPILLVIILVVYFILKIFLKKFVWPYFFFMVSLSIILLPLWIVVSTSVFSKFRQCAGTEEKSNNNIISNLDTIFKWKKRNGMDLLILVYKWILSLSEKTVTTNPQTEIINPIIQSNTENSGINPDLIQNK